MLTVADFLIVITSIIGIYFFRKINNTYVPFIWYLLAVSITELSYYANFSLGIRNFIINIYALISTQLILALFFNWDKRYPIFKIKLFAHIIFACIVVLDIYIGLNSEIHMWWGRLFLYLIISIYGIFILNQTNGWNNFNNSYISKALIIIPILVFSIYYIAIKISMFFLYKVSSAALFENLYDVIRFINIISYVCFSLSLIIAPKQERYLNTE